MPGYVDKQVAAYQKTVGDAVAGKGLQAAIKQLQEKSQIRDSLKTLPARGAITAKRNVGKRAAASTKDLIEISRTAYAVQQVYSSDGMFSFDVANINTLTFANGATMVLRNQ